MSIALDLSTAGSIATYSALIDEIRDMSDDDAYNQAAINRAIRKVEDHLNRELRTPDMERTTTVTANGEYATLPDDYLAMRAIRYADRRCVELKQMPPAVLQYTYGGCAGLPQHYAIEGKSLRFGPVPTAATFTMLYFAKIAPLTEDVQSNWVLDNHADLYVAGALYYLARRERDAAGTEAAGTEFLAIVDAVNQSASAARWGANVITPQGMTQVRGVRA